MFPALRMVSSAGTHMRGNVQNSHSFPNLKFCMKSSAAHRCGSALDGAMNSAAGPVTAVAAAIQRLGHPRLQKPSGIKEQPRPLSYC